MVFQKVDKRNTIVILNKDDYNNKMIELLNTKEHKKILHKNYIQEEYTINNINMIIVRQKIKK